MTSYHLRRKDKAMTSDEILDVIIHKNYLTFAMCRDNEPYLITVNYGFDEKKNCFYFHCARNGKKIDFLKTNNRVWGEIILDKGYIKGECDYNYSSVHFSGRVDFIEKPEEKRHALELMIDQMEDDPSSVKKEKINENSLKKVNIGKIEIIESSGKKCENKKG